MNRATADNQSAQAEEEGLEPTKEWVKDLVDEIITEEFASPDLELHWLDEDDGDPETVLADRLKLGAVTLNELRDHLGLDPYANPAADRPMVLTATGYVPIEANAGGEGVESQTSDVRSGATVQKYNPDQSRVPAGNPDGGQWTRDTQITLWKASPDDPKHPGWPAGTPEGKGGKFRPKDGDGTTTAAVRLAGGPYYPPPPPGYDANTWKQGQWPNGRYWVEDPEGNKYTAHPEDSGHWRHWDKSDSDSDDDGDDGDGQERWPPNSKKLRSNQTKPKADQSLSDPNGDAPPWTPTPFTPVVPIDPTPFPDLPILPPVLIPE